MNTATESEGFTTYGAIGLGVFILSAGLVYLIPNTFVDGTLYMVAGVLIILVTIANLFKGITYDLLNILFATVCIVIGVNKILALDIKFLPAILIAIGVIVLFNNIKKLR